MKCKSSLPKFQIQMTLFLELRSFSEQLVEQLAKLDDQQTQPQPIPVQQQQYSPDNAHKITNKYEINLNDNLPLVCGSVDRLCRTKNVTFGRFEVKDLRSKSCPFLLLFVYLFISYRYYHGVDRLQS